MKVVNSCLDMEGDDWQTEEEFLQDKDIVGRWFFSLGDWCSDSLKQFVVSVKDQMHNWTCS